MKRIEFDKGKKEGNNLSFSLEKKIKEYKEGTDYVIDRTGNFYTILSERLKKIIWPGDYLNYAESIVAIDREGKINSWRISAEKEGSIEPYKRFSSGGYEEIMSGMGGNESNGNFGRDKERKSLEQNPCREKEKIEEGMSKRLIWKEVKGNVSQEYDEKTGEITSAVNTNLEVSKLSPCDNYDSWTKKQLITEINKLKTEVESLKNDQTLTNSEKQGRLQHNQQKLQKLQSYNTHSQLNNSSEPKSNNLPTNLIIGGTVLAVIGLVSFLFIRKVAKIKKRS